MASLCVPYKGRTITGLGPCPTKGDNLEQIHQGANLEPPHQGTYLEQASWAGGLGVSTPVLLLAWEPRAVVFFLAKKRSKSSFRLCGRLGQGRDWSSSLDLEGWVGDLSQPRCRLSMGTSYGRSPRGGAHRWSDSLEKVSGLSRLLLSALLLSRYPFRTWQLTPFTRSSARL